MTTAEQDHRAWADEILTLIRQDAAEWEPPDGTDEVVIDGWPSLYLFVDPNDYIWQVLGEDRMAADLEFKEASAVAVLVDTDLFLSPIRIR